MIIKIMSAREAKNAFGLMIDTGRTGPVGIEKHERGVVEVLSVGDYERLSAHPKTESGTCIVTVEGNNIGN